ncbi:MAG: AzlC family ABC transporter permease [Treponema sp.]|nr:AzlC family ABC transporter permease [Candidatus Treponema equifaecale]
MNDTNNGKLFWNGLAAGIPIGLGYFAVSFSLGIVAKHAGLTPLQGFIASFFNLASAGEYALFTSIQQMATCFEIAIITLVVNARYLLMSCALSQKFDAKTPFFHRFFIGFAVTDELFGLAISRPGKIKPAYNYGAIIIATLLWSLGTSLGIVAGNILPERVVSALSVALYGMFIAIIVPPARKDLVIRIAVLVSFVASWICSVAPVISGLSSGTRTIILTVAISAVCAIIKPVKEETDSAVVETNSAVVEKETAVVEPVETTNNSSKSESENE